MDVFSPVNTYGAAVLAVMMVFYALENRNAKFTLYFAVTCIFSSAYGFLSGAWPFGVIEIVWTGVSLRKYVLLMRNKKNPVPS